MKNQDKLILIQVLDNLIRSYENKSNSHSSVSCALCREYDSEGNCQKCPNSAFSTRDYTGCAARCRAYPRLSYRTPVTYQVTHENDQVIAEFWKEVRDYLIQRKKVIGRVELNQVIIEIANKYV